MYLNAENLNSSATISGSTVKEKTITLIIIDDTFDTEEIIVKSLRNEGYTARSARAEDEEDLIEAIESQPPEIVIYFNNVELISLQQTRECLNKYPESKLARIIAVDKKEPGSVVNALRSGARDLVSFDNIAHLLLVIQREHLSLADAHNARSLKNLLKETEKRCNSLLDSSRAAIAYIHEGMHVYSNQSYLDLFEISASDELEGMPILDMITISERDAFKTFLRNHANNENATSSLQTQLLKSNGELFEGEIELSPASIDNEPCIQLIIRQEETNSEELEKQLKLLSQKDQLTGLFNRQYFIESLEQTIADCEQGQHNAAIMEIHLDNFDSIKDTVGIADADKYIAAAAEVLNKNTGESDILARYTHSTFTCITLDCDKEHALSLAENFQKILSEFVFKINDNSINTTCCIGATLIDTDAPEYNSILARLEKSMQEATGNGANQICIYEPEKGELSRHEADTRFKEQLTNALKNDNFVLHFQPIVSLHGDTEERYEVFLRLKNVEKNEDFDLLIMPNDFLPAAERIGMAIAIDRWVLYQTIKHITKRWQNGHTTRLILKLSASSLKDDTLIDWLSYQVKEKKLPANSLAFVVKENAAVTNLKYTKELSQKVRSLNCEFIIDDFGSGANPFQLLQHIHADYVRIDPSFMENLAENTQHQEHIKLISDQATQLGKKTIAQHVPDASSLSILWGLGVNFIQGNFLQEPIAEMNYDFTEMSG